MTIDVLVQPVVDLAAFPLGGRRLVLFDGGTFPGRDGLHGTLAPGGADWQLVRRDGMIEIDAHYVLQTTTARRSRSARPGLRTARADVVGPHRRAASPSTRRVLLPHAHPAVDRRSARSAG